MNGDGNMKLEKEIVNQSLKAAKGFLSKLISPALEESGGIIQDTIGYWRLKNIINISLKAKKFLEDKGIEPSKVMPKTLVSILENGSLEEDDNMQNRWAALLANAADPNKRYSLESSFTEILKEISPLEVEILDKMFYEANQNTNSNKDEIFFDKEKICQNLKIDGGQFDMIADNLFRLNLCQPPASFGGVKIGEYPVQLRTYKLIGFTQLGYEFVKLCRF